MRRCAVLLALLLPAARAGANTCALPQMTVAGAGTLSGNSKSAVISAGLVAGVAAANNIVLSIGLQFVSVGAFTCFLSTETPLAVAALPGTRAVQRLVPSAGRSMMLEWTAPAGLLPVTYDLHCGASPSSMAKVATGLQTPSYLMLNLSYMKPYYWQVVAVDQFGRVSPSEVYSFSIAPVQDHMIAAPNPFHPGRGGTTFMWTMPGPGSAELEIFSLPDSRRVFKTRLDGLQDGVNTYAYDGRESNGQLLPNGVYTARMMMKGANGDKTELFKLLSVR